jgi:2-methylisocitrate lyase-like PEP mutase family enzyme
MNLEDQMKPFDEAVAAVRAVVGAADAEGVDFALNARTDAMLKVGDGSRSDALAEAIRRGLAFLDEGATCVFVPGVKEKDEIEQLVAGLGERKVSLIAAGGSLPLSDLEGLGVARVSVGPWSQRLALTALADTAASMLSGGSFPDGVRPLN